jgi:L-threonylcarbamoyladenylate synthase
LRPEIVKISSQAPEASLVTYAAEKIRAGEVLGMPTDTYYGLAVDPFNLHAVDRVYEIKTRSRHKPLSLLIESVDQAAELAWPVPEIFYLLARRFWPGPLTIIVKADPKLPLKVTANTGNVALRVPAAEVPLAIIRSAGLPITATSANLHGETECVTAVQVRDQLGDRLSIIVDGGKSPGKLPSTIVDVTDENGGWRLLRHGAIPEEQIVELLGRE